MSTRIKKEDTVIVISGEHKGKFGKVKSVDLKKQRVVVEGVNMGNSTLRKTQNNPQGGLISRERSIHISNVKLQGN